MDTSKRCVIALGIFAIFALFMAADAPKADAWYNTDWDYRREIQIDNAYVENSDFTNFPTLIQVTLPDATTIDNGDDVLFTDNTGDALIPYEIENFDGENLIAWVRVPTLYDNENACIYVYYGNASADGSLENVEGVWDDNYMMVQHLSEPSGTYVDSTSNNNDSSASTMTYGADGQIHHAALKDTNTERITIPDSDELDITGNFTIEAWCYVIDAADFFFIVGKGNADGPYEVSCWSSDDMVVYRNNDYAQAGTKPPLNAWTRISFSTTGSNCAVYHNEQLNVTLAGLDPGAANATDLEIGARTGGNYGENGRYDEVRISNLARSGDYLVTAFRFENDSGGISLGAEESAPTISVALATVNNAIIDRDQDIAGSVAVLTTTISVQVEVTSSDNADALTDNCHIWVYDALGTLVVDNASQTDNVLIDENTIQFNFPAYNPSDALGDSSCGAFRVYATATDNENNFDNSNNTTAFVVDDVDNVTLAQENLPLHRHRVYANAARVSADPATLNTAVRVDTNVGSANAAIAGVAFENTYAPTAVGWVWFEIELNSVLDGFSDNFNYNYPNITVDNISVTVDNSLIDNHRSDNAITATLIEVVFRDNDNYDDFEDDFWIAVRDFQNVLVDNENVSSTVTFENENYAVLTLTYDAEDNNFAAADMGVFDVWSYAADNWDSHNFWNLSTFTVADIEIPVNLAPDNVIMGYASGFNILVTGTMTRMDGAAISIDNSWLVDAAEGTIVMGANDSYSENYLINSAPGTPNITITVSAYDGVLDGENENTYSVNDNRLYQVWVRYEENWALYSENMVENYGFNELTFIYADGSTEEFTMSQNPENFIVTANVWKARLDISGENYWRMRIPDHDPDNITFYFPDNASLGELDLYTFTLIDVTGIFGKDENGELHLYRYYWDNQMRVNDDYWDVTNSVQAWLWFGEEYISRLRAGNTSRVTAQIKALEDTTHDIVVGTFRPENETNIWEDVGYSAFWTIDNYIRVTYQDNQENTISSHVWVYDENGDLATQSSFTTDTWTLTYITPDPETSYTVQIEIEHENRGGENVMVLMALPMVWNPPLPDTTIPGMGQLGNFPIAYGAAIGIFFSIVIGLTYGKRHEGMAVLGIAMFLVVMGPIFGAFDVPPIVIPLIAAIGVILMMIPRGGGV